jgi:hypothetical protein
MVVPQRPGLVRDSSSPMEEFNMGLAPLRCTANRSTPSWVRGVRSRPPEFPPRPRPQGAAGVRHGSHTCSSIGSRHRRHHVSIRVLRGRTGEANTLPGRRLTDVPSDSYLASTRYSRGPHATPSPRADQAPWCLHVTRILNLVWEDLPVWTFAARSCAGGVVG